MPIGEGSGGLAPGSRSKTAVYDGWPASTCGPLRPRFRARPGGTSFAVRLRLGSRPVVIGPTRGVLGVGVAASPAGVGAALGGGLPVGVGGTGVVVIRPILLARVSVNHSAASGPVGIPTG